MKFVSETFKLTRFWSLNDVETTEYKSTQFYHRAARGLYRFYRAMLCIARTMSSQDVCPSVRPSVRHTPVLSKRLNVSSNFFHRRVVTPFDFFRTKQYGNTVFQKGPRNGCVECKGYKWKNRDFRPIPLQNATR